MENLTKIEPKNVNMPVEKLLQHVVETINVCRQYAHEKNWQISNTSKCNTFNMEGILLPSVEPILKTWLNPATKSQRKKLTRLIIRLQKKMTLTRINNFHKKLNQITSGQIAIEYKPSLTEQKAMELRKKYLKSLAETKTIREEYKKAKKELQTGLATVKGWNGQPVQVDAEVANRVRAYVR